MDSATETRDLFWIGLARILKIIERGNDKSLPLVAPDVSNFYDKWLSHWDISQKEKKLARKVIHEEELEWVSTVQDARAALLVAPETGFRTWGSVTMLGEIPVGWHTGRHKHGEEGIHIVQGRGFSIVNGRRYDWKKGCTLWMSFGSAHQHFNTGGEPALYYSASALHLEHFCGINKIEQLEECGPNGPLPETRQESQFDENGRRIVLNFEDGLIVKGGEDSKVGTQAEQPNQMHKGAGHHESIINFMCPELKFQNREVTISGILVDAPHSHGGKHAHMEAILYCLQGEGYTVVDDERIPWKKGTCFHIQGPQTVHQHFIMSDVQSNLLRTAFGIRQQFFQPIAKEMFPYLWFQSRGEIEARE